MPTMTGWIRYRICDSSGIGWDRHKWLFSPGLDQNEPQTIEDLIIHNYEDWARWAQSYSFEFDVGLLPPLEKIEEKIESKKRQLGRIYEELETLQKHAAQVMADGQKG